MNGFDMKYANEWGMWGVGLYFAENASYTDENCFSHEHQNSTLNTADNKIVKGMFLATVNLGEVQYVP